MTKACRRAVLLCTALIAAVPAAARTADPAPGTAQTAPATKRPNIVFILNDDQRYDAMGFLDPELKTPNMDFIAKNGVYFKNAVVTTALCSPSRASIMTGRYMHNHGIADNNIKFAPGTRLFSESLKAAGYNTAFMGKWHMGGETDSPQPGFDHWISFKGQGNYLPTDKNGRRHIFNIDGKRVEQRGYITDELNQYALDWLKTQSKDKPFMLYLSHKAVHADFIPAERHKGLYANEDIALPASMADTPANYDGKPMWVKNQRNSWHGVDFPYHSTLDIKDYKRRYYQTLGAVDDGIGAIIAELKKKGMLENTVVMMMGDNGFLFGEHGMIDKRSAYEESMRVPLIAFSGGTAKGKVVTDVVANIDIAPTFLALAGAKPEAPMDGMSFANQLEGKPLTAPWRKDIAYEYYWEYNYPQTPSTFALRGDRYKLIQYHGIWDTEELYDLQNDPQEMHNLIEDKALQPLISDMRASLFDKLDFNHTGRSSITFTERLGVGAVFRNRAGSKAAEFPDKWLRNGNESDLRDAMKNEGGRGKKAEAEGSQ